MKRLLAVFVIFMILVMIAVTAVVPADCHAVPAETSANGDVNQDGSFDIADVIMLQKWILNKGNLTCWENADFYADHKLDVFDLCLMKRKLFEQMKDRQVKEMIVQVGDQEFTARLYQNPTADELIRQLPLTLDMNELNGNEKYYYFSESLPADAGQIGKINAGDIMLYGSKCLVLFYDSFATPYSYTRIGYVENPAGLADALGDGNVEITFKLK